jgi:hypothetical protein
MKERGSFSALVVKRYQKATKKEKGTILEEYTQMTGYNRCYAAFLVLQFLGISCVQGPGSPFSQPAPLSSDR